MKTTINKKIRTQLDAILNKLRVVDEHMAWLIKADARFHVGQRVEWSRHGRARGFPTRKSAQVGTVKAVNGFSIVVKLDSLKQQSTYHHSFFNPVTGPKLF